MDTERGVAEANDSLMSGKFCPASRKWTQKILAGAERYLEGESPRVLFFGQRPIWPPFSSWTLFRTCRAVIVTDHKVHVFKAGNWTARIKKRMYVLERPVPTRLTRYSITLGDKRKIHKPLGGSGWTDAMRAAAALAEQPPPDSGRSTAQPFAEPVRAS